MIGRGAGQDATASSIISDLADAVAILQGANILNSKKRENCAAEKLTDSLELTSIDAHSGCYYLRVHVKDQEGVLSKVSDLLAKQHISVATVNQKQVKDGTALIMLTTSITNERAIASAKITLSAQGAVLGEPVSFRIFDPS